MEDNVKRVPRILIVDDYADAREMYREFLVFKGYDVMEATNGREALEKASATTFDLIVLDLALPKIDGMQVIKALHEGPKTRGLPIIVLSGSVQPAVRNQVLKAGAALFLKKHCLPEELEAAMRAFVSAAERRS